MSTAAEADMVGMMARVLRALHIDLDDERAVLRALNSANYRAGDVVLLHADAITEARKQNAEFGEPQ
jgi:hypothetical protein